jgi:hypothetical protein
MVVREPENTSVSGWKYEMLTKWRPLPKGVLFHQPTAGKSLLSVVGTGGFNQANLQQGPTLSPGESLNVIGFNEAGAVSFPSGDRAELKLIISEGIRGTGGTEATISAKKSAAGGFEIISFSRFSGRSQLDVTTVAN